MGVNAGLQAHLESIVFISDGSVGRRGAEAPTFPQVYAGLQAHLDCIVFSQMGLLASAVQPFRLHMQAQVKFIAATRASRGDRMRCADTYIACSEEDVGTDALAGHRPRTAIG